MTASSREIRTIFIIGCSVKLMHSKVFSLYAFLFCSSLLHCAARDTITKNTFLSDNGGETIVSPRERFELGFFTPNGSSSIRRYVGIWYYKSSPRTVVWVANQNNPILDYTGALSVSNDGNLKVTDGSGKSYWSTNLEGTPQIYRIAKLMDSGNLVLNDQERILWQSFDNPTDTFLPGMKLDEDIVLISWKSHDDPAPGNFSFRLNQEGDNKYVIWKRSMRYWTSDASGKLSNSDEMPFAISYLLSNFSASSVENNSVPYLEPSLYTDTRMVLSFSGQIQCLKLDTDKIWSLIWAEPRDICSLYNACGNFGLCNSKNNLVCKCLPGFNPSSPDYWSAGDFSDGCTRRSSLCGKNAMRDTTYLSLKAKKVGDPDSKFAAKNEMECKLECLNNCQCQAFSYEETQTNKSSPGVSNCWIWSEDLNSLEEEYDSGRNINVRVAVSDIESTERNCKMCGANLIPYPLSTGLDCGDPMYFNFHCNISTAQVNFETPSGIYQVKSINPETRKFVIQAENTDACEAGKSNFQLNLSSPFHVISWCNSGSRNFSDSDVSLTSIDEVEISWKPPPEPTCTSPLDCKDWPNSICSATKYGRRCICNTHFKWDGFSLNCSEESSSNQHVNEPLRGRMSFSIIIAVSFMSVISLIILMSVTAYICLKRIRLAEEQGSRGTIRRYSGLNLYGSERCVKEMIDSNRFSEDDTKGIDVPFFTLESILAATNNFALANRLGQGGFGTVYKAKFPGGEQIAVKRLSSASGQGSEEFKNEVLLIAKLQHRNLVRLLGYCVEGEEKMLLYEFMPNKSLDSFIFDRKLCTSLDWEMRYKIILGIARGLLYLHQDSRLRIIHRDLKTSNILLDEDMNPKISDFGLARIFGGSKETAVNTKRVVGTYGYMSPEYALDGLFSFKSDVFSFGVVVLEIITGKRNTGFYEPAQSLSLLGYSWHLWKEDKALDLLDKTLNVSCNLNELYKCLNVGLLCLQEDPSDRPTMSNVVFMLGSETASLPTPKQPAFIARRCSSNKASSSSKQETFSNNELTVTLYDGR